MGEEYALICAPSSTLFIRNGEIAAQKAAARNERVLSVGNPAFDHQLFPGLSDLPSAAEEAEAIARLYGSGSLLVGPEAKKGSLLTAIGQADVVHLAMHYVADERSPMLSYLPLAAGPESHGDARASRLEMHEVYGLKLAQARLVVLSACQTGAEEYFKGEGVIGLSRPFEAANVPLVISSLWPVDSTATQKLMIRFHQLRRRSGHSTINALREAQQELLHGEDVSYRHPYYWAAFIIVGGYSSF
jgi:CHAT domain-containing protein